MINKKQEENVEEKCPYCETQISEKTCKCGMLQILNGKCLISDGVIVLKNEK